MTTHLFTQPASPTFILVHGGWHGAWCWNKVLPLLKEKGVNAIAIDLPGHGEDKTPVASVTLDDYVSRIVEAANSIEGRVILLGHSSGGIPIAQAAERLALDKVTSLVFLDAFMPQDGETVFSLVQKYPSKANGNKGAALAESLLFSADKKSTTLKLDNVQELLYHDCSETDVAYAKAHLGAQPMATQTTPVGVTEKVYGAIPKYYILCTKAKDFDKTMISTNVDCKKIYRLKSSHSPFFAMPDELVKILEDIYKQSSVAVTQ
ncbi:MAG TPA: alpha/beta fold hydrolase [Flavisolibacter sp.]|nr:alpha/beta fold hydrolase [Flavisolibacter sp.]